MKEKVTFVETLGVSITGQDVWEGYTVQESDKEKAYIVKKFCEEDEVVKWGVGSNPEHGFFMMFNNLEDAKEYAKKMSRPSSFRERVFEIAFGDGAINKGYTTNEVLDRLREFSDDALAKNKEGG